MRTVHAKTARRRVGTALLAAALAVAAWSVGFAPAAAQEQQAPEDLQQAETQRAAYYQAPTERILPATLVSEFPPGVICVVRPEICPESLEPVFTPVEEGLTSGRQAQAENEPEGAAPLPPDTLPVSATGGKPDYRSAIQFTLPSVPEGQQVDTFKVYLTESSPTYAVSSPAFRQAVLALLTCARECDQEQFEKIQETQPAEQEHLDVEICPIADDPSTSERSADWEEGDAQKDTHLPEADCLFGANGTRIDRGEEAALWEFDLTFTLQGLVEGQFGDNGFLIRPANLPNLAFGDPDTSFNKQIVFERDVAYTIATSDAPEPAPVLDLGGDLDTGGASGGDGFGASSGSSGGFSTPTAGVSSSSDAFAAPGGQTADEAAAAPEVAGPSEPADGGFAAPAAGTEDPTLAAGAEDGAPATAWWVWALVPIFLGGMYLTSQSLLAAPALAGPERAGAMTRLIEKRHAAAVAPGPELVQF